MSEGQRCQQPGTLQTFDIPSPNYDDCYRKCSFSSTGVPQPDTYFNFKTGVTPNECYCVVCREGVDRILCVCMYGEGGEDDVCVRVSGKGGEGLYRCSPHALILFFPSPSANHPSYRALFVT